VPPDKWYWSDKPTHPAIVDRDTWEAAQRVGAEHRSSRDGAIYNPANWRTYAFRSRVRCKICKRRMCGQPKAHPHRKNPTEYNYYVCQFNPKTPGHVAAAPDHPRTVQVREDFLRTQTLAGLAAYALAPGREQRLTQLIPHTASEKKQQHDRQTTALTQRLKRITVQQDNLMRELSGSFDMPDEAGEQYRRRIRADYTTLHDERTTIQTQLTQLAADDTTAPDPDLVSLLPEVTADLAGLPPGLQTELFDVFDIQIIWNAPIRQATFRATITDTTPTLITALLARASDNPASEAANGPAASHPTRANTSTGPVQGSFHTPID
jgi:site-specific DNA recombinase